MALDPQTELYKMLAEARIRGGAIATLHRQSVESIPERQDRLLTRMRELSQQINSEGLGKNPKAEDEYLQILQDLQYLDQSWLMAQPRDQKPSGMPQELKKTVMYGELLWDLYSARSLVKGVVGDIGAIAHQLADSGYPEAEELAERLRSLC